MTTIDTSLRAWHPPGLPLSLCELLAHIPRELETNFIGQISIVFSSDLQSKLR